MTDHPAQILAEGLSFTVAWGINTTLPGGSLLIVNHEHWNFPESEPDVDVIGLRWVATF